MWQGGGGEGGKSLGFSWLVNLVMLWFECYMGLNRILILLWKDSLPVLV